MGRKREVEMVFRRSNKIILLCLMLSVFLLNGCATTMKIPIKLDPNFNAKVGQTIVLMPIVDRRVDKTGSINLETQIRKPVKKLLEKKGYTVVLENTFIGGTAITPDEVGEMNIDELSELGPQNAKVVLFVFVEDIIDSYAVTACAYRIEATGSLIEKREKLELWRDKGIDSKGGEGLAAGVLAGLVKASVISSCLHDTFVTLPKAPEPSGPSEKLEVEERVTFTNFANVTGVVAE
jgi:hypothetical protein